MTNLHKMIVNHVSKVISGKAVRFHYYKIAFLRINVIVNAMQYIQKLRLKTLKTLIENLLQHVLLNWKGRLLTQARKNRIEVIFNKPTHF